MPGGLNKDEEPGGPGEVGAAPLPPSGLLQLLPRHVLLFSLSQAWLDGWNVHSIRKPYMLLSTQQVPPETHKQSGIPVAAVQLKARCRRALFFFCLSAASGLAGSCGMHLCSGLASMLCFGSWVGLVFCFIFPLLHFRMWLFSCCCSLAVGVGTCHSSSDAQIQWRMHSAWSEEVNVPHILVAYPYKYGCWIAW